MKKIFLFTILFLFSFTNVFADNSYFIDFNKVLNTSKAGSEAQKKLKTSIESESNKYKKIEQKSWCFVKSRNENKSSYRFFR